VSDEQHLIRDHHGQPMEVVGSWSEVTARKTAEQAALQASEQRLTDAIESISEGFSLYDAQDRLVLGNYKYKELFDHGEGPPKPGMTYEEILRTVVESGLIQDARSRPEACSRSVWRSIAIPASRCWSTAPMEAGFRSASGAPRMPAGSPFIAI
jgi:PAS domain-containing protein